MSLACGVVGTRRALIGLGANLPYEGRAPSQTLKVALHALEATPGIHVLSCSSLWNSKPVMAEGPHFINAATEIETVLDPESLLEALLQIEARFGRHRPQGVSHSQPAPSPARTLDLDLIWMDGLALSLPHLSLPHPRAASRAFVLAPLAELRPGLCLETGPEAKTIEVLLSEALREDPSAVSRIESEHVVAA